MSNSPGPRVSVIFPEHYPQVSTVLGRAFINDPPLRAVLPGVTDPIERARCLGDLFSVVLKIQRQRGQPVFGIVQDGKVLAAAVVEGVHSPSMGAMVLSGLATIPRTVAALGLGGLVRAIRLGNELSRNHPPQPHLYLSLLGADPDHRGRHYGIALLDHLCELAQARPDVIGVYLDTGTEANVGYYQRAGYEVIGEMKPLGVRMWRMLQTRRAAG